jgi:hypothetical protein
MAFLNDLQRLSDLRASGNLTDAEFTAAKQRLLASEQPTVKPRDVASERLLLEAELTRVDREFEQERRQCLSYDRYGYGQEPSGVWRFIFPFVGLAGLGVLGMLGSSDGFGSQGIGVGIGVLILIGVALGFFSNEVRLSRLNAAKERRDAAKGHAMRRMNALRRDS